jgi:hypothetical protein
VGPTIIRGEKESKVLRAHEEEKHRVQNEGGNHDGDPTLNGMEQEIECPRCYDITTLSSSFDRLGYVCQECDLLLVMK